MIRSIEPMLHPTPIADLRPTQMTVGMREVRLKRGEWKAKREAEGSQYLGIHMIPAVKGPDGKFWILDHHHLVLALHEEGVIDVLVSLIADLGSLKTGEFLTFMDNLNWLHPYDGNGRRRKPKHLPRHIADLKDDPFRALAGEARRRGAFAKSSSPYAEFLWADFFRDRIAGQLAIDDFSKALRKALKLSRSDCARHLPGYVRSS